MKKRLKRTIIFLMTAAMILGMGIVDAFADAAPGYTDWHRENYDVVVAATDGSGYLYLRYGPGMNYDIICEIYDGTVLHVSASAADDGGEFRWGSVSYNGQYGWISLVHTREYSGDSGGSSVSETAADFDVQVAATDGSGYLYLRQGPTMNDTILCNIYDGTVLHISATATDSSGSFQWGKTSYDGQTGWVSLVHTKSYTAAAATPAATPKPTTAPVEKSADYDVAVAATDGTGYLYLREGPGMDYTIIETVYDGTRLHISAVTEDAGGTFSWGKTEYHGHTGWVSLLHVMDYAQYEKEHPAATAEPTATATPKPTAAATEAPTATPAQTVTVTPEATATPEAVKTAEPTRTAAPTETAAPTQTAAATPKPTETAEPAATETAAPTETPSAETVTPEENGKPGFLEALSGTLGGDGTQKDPADKKDRKNKDKDEDDDDDEKDSGSRTGSEGLLGLFQNRLLVIILIAVAAVAAAVAVLLVIRAKKNK